MAVVLRCLSGKNITIIVWHIKNGVFVSPSRMEAESYGVRDKIHSKRVALTDVAWIDAGQGQYAKVDDNVKYSLSDIDRYTEKQYNDYGWVKVHDALTGNELTKLYSQFSDIKNNKFYGYRNRKGEYLIPVGNEYDTYDHIVYISGTNKHPKISQVIGFIDKNIDSNIRTSYITEVLDYESVKHFDNSWEIVEAYAGQQVFSRNQVSDYSTYSQVRNRARRQARERIDTGNRGWNNRTGIQEEGRNLGPVANNNETEVASNEATFSNAQNPTENTNVKYSLSKDSDGRELSEQQREYFRNSKVRDADGNLLRVYHGTDAEFTVFDRTKGRVNMDIQGSFFSPWELDAQGYGTNVKAYYLNITNPASEQIGYKALRMFQGQNNAGVKAREYLESLGYDGVNNGNEEYIAFNSNQIKLADNTNPTDSEDVRYSEKDFPIDSDISNLVSSAISSNSHSRVEIGLNDIKALQSIGKKSINDFNESDIKTTEKWARKFYRELGNKSPFFRAWFGDWRAYDNSNVLVVKIDGNANTKSINQSVKNRDIDKLITIDKNLYADSMSKATNKVQKSQILKILYNADKIIENAILLDTSISLKSTKNKKGSTQFMHYLYSIVEINKAPFLVKITVEEYDVDGKLRAYNAKKIKMSSISREDFANTKITKSRHTIGQNNDSTYKQIDDWIKISQLFDYVNTFDDKFNPHPVNKDLLNNDGTPRLLYHGTNAMFDVFDFSKIGKFDTGTAYWDEELKKYVAKGDEHIFLTADKGLAQSHAEGATETDGGQAVVMPLYASLQNPYIVEIDEWYARRKYYTSQDWYDKHRLDILKEYHKGNYDGLIIINPVNENDVMVGISRPNQVKSATDNIGTFSEYSDSIKYSQKETPRDILLSTFSGLAQNDIEQKYLDDYRKNITELV